MSAKNIKDGELKINSDSDRKISWSDFQIIHGNFNPLPGDVLLTIVGSIGESCVLKKADGIAFQRSVAFLRPTPSTDSFFLKAGTETQHFQNELNDRKSSSAQAGIYLGALSLVPIRAPCLLEQKELGRFFIKVDFAIALHQRKCF